ncbi:C39 family peptidase [Streptococcus halichoeri]|uniref:C39 family peptidase n=1 Tax=Streptococcus halichoeri TaxID=254785 RepID=UPI001358313A|nr:C39 family peptidase [Streptococcus halichoeri]
MNQAKIITGLAVATLSTGAGIVHAEDVTSTPSINEPQVSSETAKTPQVTESQVLDAKETADKATSNVNAQQAIVNDAQARTNQAQNNVVNATTAVTDATETVKQATPEAITKAQASVAEANTAVSTAERNLTIAQTEATQANTAVANQTQVVAKNQTNVEQAQTDANKAQEVVNTAKQAIDTTQANSNLADAEKVVAEKTTNVATAETNLTNAKQADAKLAEKTAQAQEIVTQKDLAVKNTQSLLNQVATELNNEKVKTSLQNQAYYNQRDGAWARNYGNNSFAATGCVPTSLAMVFSELARRGVTPTEVANYLYNNTNYFNKYFSGTSANGIVAASKHFGFVPTHLASQAEIIKALQDGHHVVSAVQNNKFSPWGAGYSHEIVLRGYSNGNAYVYDPYNRANIGWYPVASLWSEQSRDKDDSALGAPFFKIVTQKMAQVEAQKTQLTSALNTAKSQLAQTKQTLSSLQATAFKTPEAQVKLDQAKEALALAQADYAKAQEAVKLASQDLAVKEETLKNAQADLLTKQTALKDAQTVFVASQAKLADLKATLATVENNVKKAQATLTDAKAIAGQKQADLQALQNAPKILADAQAKLVTAKNDLADKMAILDEAVAKLKELEAIKEDAQNQYHVVFEAYKAVRDAKKQAELAESYAHIIAGGGEAIPVVDETGKITGYVDGSKRVLPKENLMATSSKAVTPVMESKEIEKVLPSTGEAGLSLLSVVGTGLISILGIVSLKKRRTH